MLFHRDPKWYEHSTFWTIVLALSGGCLISYEIDQSFAVFIIGTAFTALIPSFVITTMILIEQAISGK